MADEMTFRPHVIRAIREKEVRVEPYSYQGNHGSMITSGKRDDGDYRVICTLPPKYIIEFDAITAGDDYIERVRALTPKQISDLESAFVNGNGIHSEAMREVVRQSNQRR